MRSCAHSSSSALLLTEMTYLLSPAVSTRGPPRSSRRLNGWPRRALFGVDTSQPKTFAVRFSKPPLTKDSLPSRRSSWTSSNLPLPRYCTLQLPEHCGRLTLVRLFSTPASATVFVSSSSPPPMPSSIAISSGETPIDTLMRRLTEPIVSSFLISKVWRTSSTSPVSAPVSSVISNVSPSSSSSSSSPASARTLAGG